MIYVSLDLDHDLFISFGYEFGWNLFGWNLKFESEVVTKKKNIRTVMW
jgi:hypothetical protein